jgi:hypothetical protein
MFILFPKRALIHLERDNSYSQLLSFVSLFSCPLVILQRFALESLILVLGMKLRNTRK